MTFFSPRVQSPPPALEKKVHGIPKPPVNQNIMSSLDAILLTAFCYTLECEPRTDVELTLPCSYYVGSSSNVHLRVTQHFAGVGSKFTRRFKPRRVHELDVQTRLTEAEVLAFENETVLRLMEKMTRDHPDVPDAWRAVAGGSYCKLDQQMPAELRRRLSRAVSSTESSS
jgi:predicted GIY-YIG superfamily endonuclease